jgi:hypothetical protein
MSSFDLLHFDTNDRNCTFTGQYGNAYDVNFTLSNSYKTEQLSEEINEGTAGLDIFFNRL